MKGKTLLIIGMMGILLAAGGYLFLKNQRGNLPAFAGQVLPVEGVKPEVVEVWKGALEKASQDDEMLAAVVEKSHYAKVMEVSEGDAVGHLKKAVSVKFNAKKKWFEVGVNGLRKDYQKMKKVVKVLVEEVQKKTVQIEPSYEEYYEYYQKSRSNGAL